MFGALCGAGLSQQTFASLGGRTKGPVNRVPRVSPSPCRLTNCSSSGTPPGGWLQGGALSAPVTEYGPFGHAPPSDMQAGGLGEGP